MLQALIGLSFLSVMTEVFLVQNRFKKYIQTLSGCLALLVLLQSVFSLGEIQMDYGLLEEAQRSAEMEHSIMEDQLQKEALLLVEKRIREALLNRGIVVQKVRVEFEGQYEIKKITLSFQDASKYGQEAIDILVGELAFPREVIGVQ